MRLSWVCICRNGWAKCPNREFIRPKASANRPKRTSIRPKASANGPNRMSHRPKE
ncbi:MAG: hypothetical protein GX072_11040, partial [Lysinibacillus sp.]|nr:hypothetical protein [Lysinibacillus sp.]